MHQYNTFQKFILSGVFFSSDSLKLLDWHFAPATSAIKCYRCGWMSILYWVANILLFQFWFRSFFNVTIVIWWLPNQFPPLHSIGIKNRFLIFFSIRQFPSIFSFHLSTLLRVCAHCTFCTSHTLFNTRVRWYSINHTHNHFHISMIYLNDFNELQFSLFLSERCVSMDFVAFHFESNKINRRPYGSWPYRIENVKHRFFWLFFDVFNQKPKVVFSVMILYSSRSSCLYGET